MMKMNVGKTERAFRVVLGVILLAIPGLFAFPTWAGVVSYIIGAIAIVTGAIGYCPAWQIFGLNTCERKASESKSA
ncbi:MAG: DUF2892 domain-containing protein [Nitrospirae bacterium]|nr:MAG: DUF2892 domain-containing protein [Nitrospirota bacterium]